MSEALIELFRQNVWATDRIFAMCEDLTDSQLDAEFIGSFGSIRQTMVHLVGAQERFASALAQGPPILVNRERRPFTSLEELRTAAQESGDVLIGAASIAEDGQTVTIVDRGTTNVMPAWVLLTQAITHAIEHRTQIAGMLTMLGIAPEGMDGWTYHEELFGADWSRLWSS